MYVRNKMNRSRDCGFDPCNRPQYFLLRGHTGPRGCPGMPGMPGSHGGPPGPTGAAGASSKIVVGATDPLVPPPPGQNIYVNPVGGNVYSSLAGVWTLIGNIKGHTGQRGLQGLIGQTGIPGLPALIYSDPGPPLFTPPYGSPLYYDTTNSDIYQYISGSWVWLANIRGLRGHTGQRGERGTTGHKGEKGQTGHRGHTGQRGKEGITGARGKEGVTGKRGKEGSTGARGKEGSTGAKGKQVDPGQGITQDTYELASNVTSFGPNISAIGLPFAFTPTDNGTAVIMSSTQGSYTWDGTGTLPRFSIANYVKIQGFPGNIFTRTFHIISYGQTGVNEYWNGTFISHIPVTAGVTYEISSTLTVPVGITGYILPLTDGDQYYNLTVTYKT